MTGSCGYCGDPLVAGDEDGIHIGCVAARRALDLLARQRADQRAEYRVAAAARRTAAARAFEEDSNHAAAVLIHPRTRTADGESTLTEEQRKRYAESRRVTLTRHCARCGIDTMRPVYCADCLELEREGCLA